MVKLRILPPRRVTLRIPDTQVILQSSEERYRGPYQVIPAVIAQTLETRDKLMTADVTIREIPKYEVSNAAGGQTLIIGGN